MKLCILLVLVAVAACQASDVGTRGVLSDVTDTIQKVLDKETAIQQKIQDVISQIQQVITDTKSWWESIKAETSPQPPLEYLLEQLYEKLVAEITAIAGAILDEILKVAEMIVDKVDSFLEGIFGGNTMKEAVYQFLDDLLGQYVRMVLDAIRQALEFLNFLEEYDWSAFIDRIINSVEESLNKKLDDFNQKIQEKIRPRSPKPMTYGIVGDVKDFVNQVAQGQTWVQEKLKELAAKIDGLVEDVKNWRSELQKETSPDMPMEHYAKALQEKVLAEVTAAIDTIFDEVVSILRTVIDKLDALFDKIFGASGVKDQLFGWLDQMIGELIDTTTDLVRKALEVLNKIENFDFSGYIDSVVESVKNQLNEKLGAIRNEIKKKIGRH